MEMTKIQKLEHEIHLRDIAGQQLEAELAALKSSSYESVNAKLLAACEAALIQLDSSRLDRLTGVAVTEILEVTIAAARAQAEDDATPVDKVWLELLGVRVIQNCLVLERFYKQWMTNIFVMGGCVTSEPVGWPLEGKTRGDVRRLLCTLGASI